MLRAIGTYLATLITGVVLGVLIALLVTSKHDARIITAQARDVVSETAQSVLANVQENVRIEAKVDTVNQKADGVKTAVINELKPQKEVVYVPVNVPGKAEPQSCPPITGYSVLPVFVRSVRLFDDLCAYRTVDLTGGDTPESQAPSDVTLAEFVGTDIDTVKAYNELATRHDELVDFVVAYMTKQTATAKAAASK